MSDEESKAVSQEDKNSKPAKKRRKQPEAEMPMDEVLPPVEEPAPLERWEVLEDYSYAVRGVIIKLAKGSVVTESTHDVLGLVEGGANLAKL
ncbi:MAG: hypothetical protein GWN58_17535 [Anaerolineae bacterium]|nr:hypothetical protein [Anaerolineae bacterium]